MKTLRYISMMLFLVFTSITLFAQSGMTIQGGGAVTVNGNTYIVPSTFVCGSPMIDSRDNKVYNTVQIGTQCWMAQNLNVGFTKLGSDEQTNNSVIEKYCYNDDYNNCTTYGGLYQWAEMVQYLNGATNTTSWNPTPTGNIRGICPTGWHIPINAEWETLITYLGGTNTAGGKMKETGTSHWHSPNTSATNSSGFTGLPGGSRDADSYFYSLTYHGTFWSSSEYGTTALGRILYYSDENFRWETFSKPIGYSVRCIHD